MRRTFKNEDTFPKSACVDTIRVERIDRDRRQLSGVGRHRKRAPLGVAQITHQNFVLLPRRQENERIGAEDRMPMNLVRLYAEFSGTLAPSYDTEGVRKATEEFMAIKGKA